MRALRSRHRPLEPAFFKRPTTTVARNLLGKFLVRRVGKRELAGMIIETEAYDGFEDRASHAHRGRTARNAPMFGPAGTWYVYFVYGVHWMLNAVTGPEGFPAAVLIRGVEGAVGPGRLTKSLHIDRRFTGRAIATETGLWIEDRGVRIPRQRIAASPRIGVAYAKEWAERPYRFFLKDSLRANRT